MALDPSARYPGQIDVSDPTGYPYGAAQNITVVGDGTGTPWEEDLVNDIFGFQQALLDEAGITPSGDPDKVGASDYLSAMKLVILGTEFIGLVAVSGTFSGDVTVAGDLSVNGSALNVAVGSSLVCDGSAFFSGATEFSFPTSFTAAISAVGATFSGQVLCTSPANPGFRVTGISQLDGAVNIGGLITAGGGLLVGSAGLINSGPSQFVGDTEFGNPVTFTGDGRIRRRIEVGADNDVTTYGPATVDFVRADALTLARDYTIDDTGAEDFDEIEFANLNVTHIVTIKEPGGATLIQLLNVATQAHAVRCVRIAGTWEIAYRWMTT